MSYDDDTRALQAKVSTFASHLTQHWGNVSKGEIPMEMDIYLFCSSLWSFASCLLTLNEESKGTTSSNVSQAIIQGSVLDECVKTVNRGGSTPSDLFLLEYSLCSLNLSRSPKPNFLKDRRNSALVQIGRKAKFSSASVNSASLKKILSSPHEEIQILSLRLVFALMQDGDSGCSKLFEFLLTPESLAHFEHNSRLLEILFKEGLILIKSFPLRRVTKILEDILPFCLKNRSVSSLTSSFLFAIEDLVLYYSTALSKLEESSTFLGVTQRLLTGVVHDFVDVSFFLGSSHFACVERKCPTCSLLHQLARCLEKFVSPQVAGSHIFQVADKVDGWKFIILRSTLFPECGSQELRSCIKYLALDHGFEKELEMENHFIAIFMSLGLRRVTTVVDRTDWIRQLLDFVCLCLKNNIHCALFVSKIISLTIIGWEAPMMLSAVELDALSDFSSFHSAAGLLSSRLFSFANAEVMPRLFEALTEIALVPQTEKFAHSYLRNFPFRNWDGFQSQWNRFAEHLMNSILTRNQ
eukprot:TRINITY_DN12161_c0_g3_i1.p1 TRINITY_DN12161_c0_g3~~TRINITY_DN12161_c0_g3_i1.p1  ORF type:complete len:593 (+),score=120.25 TRINITY_DN12161_c0_g3_i1:209-1780(+)